jgi:predicted XRE-type DNA-binding protein
VSKDKIELVRGSGNVYRDMGRSSAALEQARALVAAKIIRVLDEQKLSTRDAEARTGVAHSEFSHIRNTQLRRFTLDRLIAILGKLDENVEVRLTFATHRRGARRSVRRGARADFAASDKIMRRKGGETPKAEDKIR